MDVAGRKGRIRGGPARSIEAVLCETMVNGVELQLDYVINSDCGGVRVENKVTLEYCVVAYSWGSY